MTEMDAFVKDTKRNTIWYIAYYSLFLIMVYIWKSMPSGLFILLLFSAPVLPVYLSYYTYCYNIPKSIFRKFKLVRG